MRCTILASLVASGSATGRTHADQSLAYLLSRTASSRPPETSEDVDCMWRRLAFRFAPTVQPWLEDQQLEQLHDALELSRCGERFSPTGFRQLSVAETRLEATQVYIDANNGSDKNNGTLQQPLQTVAAGLAACASAERPCDLQLREGVYYLDETLKITPAHNGMNMMAYKSESVTLSGGRQLQGLKWEPNSTQAGLFVASLENHMDELPRGVPAMRHKGARATLARYPNANAELDIFPKGYITGATAWEKPTYHGQVCDPNELCGPSVTETIPVNDSWHGMYQNWTRGSGGSCEKYNPPDSPWCSADFYLLRQFPEMHTRAPSGIQAQQHLPNAPFKKQEGAIVHAWRPGHWYTWMFELGNARTPEHKVEHWEVFENSNAVFGLVPEPKASTDTVDYLGEFASANECWNACNSSSACNNFAWHHTDFEGWAQQCYGIKGGGWAAHDQAGVTSGRGPHVDGGAYLFKAGGTQGGEGQEQGGEWFIEGLLEELDAENEYYFDQEAMLLYYIHNGTGSPENEVVVPTLDVLLDFAGSQAQPVRNVTIQGITFTENRPTFMEPRGQPSGGDWSLERQGALRLEGTESVAIRNCVFTKLDSNAISINGYNRHARVERNEFVWLGQNAIASWGRADKNDGRSGDVPLYNHVVGNFVHEIGHLQKQSSFYFQAETALATIQHNIVFNIPRAAINFNDGFGGGAEVSKNLLFNTCRESGDHGAFNSWDRLPYITTISDGSPSTRPKRNNVHRNFIVANYAADGGCLDNDDGSAYYDIHHNFCMFGGHKQNFDGHSKRSFGNIHVHPQVYGTKCIDEEAEGWDFGTSGPFGLPPKGYAEEYTDNICILPNAGDPYIVSQGGSLDEETVFNSSMVLRNNTVYIPAGDAETVVSIAGQQLSFAKFQELGFDPSSKIVAGSPPVEQISSWAEQLLDMPPQGVIVV